MPSDKAIRGKYLFLVVAQAMAFMRSGPTRLDVEDSIEDIIEAHPDIIIPGDEVFAKPGLLLGRLTNLAHTIIYNFELRDYRERKAGESEEAARQH